MKSAAIVFKDKIYAFTQKGLQSLDPKSASKFRVGAMLPLRYVTALSFKLPLNLTPEQLAVQVELKMYNEGGLDPNKDYAIDFVHYPIENENIYLVEAFAAAKEDIERLYGDIAKKIGFIDCLYPKFITYKALYEKELVPAENHLFIHMAEEEAFAAIYQKGNYIGYRGIDSLMQLAKRLGIELARLKTLLVTKGLTIERYGPEEMHIFDALQEAMFKNVEKIVYAINFKRSYFGLDRIDRIIVDFEGELIPGLRQMFLSFGVEGDWIEQPLVCCELQAQEASLALESLYVASCEESEQALNFTFFERKKPLYSYRVIQLAAALAAVTIGLGAAGWYLERYVAQQEETIAFKTQRLASLKHSSAKLFKALKRLKEQKEELMAQKEAIEERTAIFQDTLDAIPFVEQSKIAREAMMNDIVEALYRYRLSTKAIEQNGTKMAYVDLLSQDDQREKIAKFMRYLLQKRYKDVQTKEIRRVDGLYESRVKVAR